MFSLLKFGARDELDYLARQIGPEAYREHIWFLRYPAAPPPKAQGAWPFRKAVVAPSNVRPMLSTLKTVAKRP